MSLIATDFDYAPKQAALIISSFYKATGKHLIDPTLSDQTKALFNADFGVVSHGTQSDPIFNYGNKSALHLFEFTWQDFTQLPSKYSAQAKTQEERSRLLKQVNQQGYIDDYQGVRISSTGTRFFVERAIVWDVIDDEGNYRGQAAALYEWSSIEPTI